MSDSIWFRFLWIPTYLGGNRNPPIEGAYSEVRWQDTLADPSHMTRGIRWSTITYDANTHERVAHGDFLADIPVRADRLTPETHLVFFAGGTIIAVGTIIPSVRDRIHPCSKD